MARLTALPSLDIIRGFKGVLDFYLWKGLPCVRKWPHTPRSRRTEGSIAAAALFGDILKSYRLLAPTVLEAYQENANGIPRTPRDVYVSGVLGHLHERTIPAPPPPPEKEMYDAYVCLRDLKPQGTHGGSFDNYVWQTRDLTEEQADAQNICTLEANQFALPAGTYRCLISCPACTTSRHQCRLYNISAGALLLLGSSEISPVSSVNITRSLLSGRFTLEAPQTLEVQHICSTERSTYGLGFATEFADEIYTIAEFWREIPED